MKSAQQELVRATFARLAVMPEVAGRCSTSAYSPPTRFPALFKNDMRIQGVKLMAMLAMVVYNLPEPGRVLPAIHDLAVRHVEYGVKPADYDALRETALDPRAGAGGRLHARRPASMDRLLRRARRRDEGGGRRLTPVFPIGAE